LPADHSSLIAHRGVFVTGTDTGVGKTLVACALIRAIAASGRRVVGMKPIAAGARRSPEGPLNEDVELLLAAGNLAAPRARVNPYCFLPPVAPHLAARAAGIEIALDTIVAAYQELAAVADFVVVEGAGGFRVPLNAREDTAHLVARLGLPVVLVVGIRLGCLNHALLTAEAIRARGLTLAGWCANHVDPAMACAEENVAALAERLGAPLLLRIGYMREPDLNAVAALLPPSALAWITLDARSGCSTAPGGA
jgi:dethiobiotin synthetase